MSRTRRIALLALAPLVLCGAAERDSCPLAGLPMMSPRQEQQRAYRVASAVAEAVAPTATTSPSRHRGVAVVPAPPIAFPASVNFIDRDLFAAMERAAFRPTTLAGDAEFLRRVSLDLTGQIPDAATVVAFLQDSSPDKRTKKIDELLASDAFSDRWTMWFGDLVQNVSVANNSREYYLGRNAYYNWIRDSFRNGKPYDQMVRELVAGKGVSYNVAAANYFVRQMQNNGPIQDTWDNLASHSAEKFLGMPLLCLSCHSGPGHLELVNQSLRIKTRTEFWGMAAFFARTRAQVSKYTDPNNPNANLNQYDVQDGLTGQYQLNTTSGNKSPRQASSGQPTSVSPSYMFTKEAPRPGEPWREAYGRMLTADRQFARAAVNYFWKEMFGIALVEPVNAFDLSRLDPSNLPAGQTVQPSNPQLLEDLTDAFIASGFNVRSILKTIASSSSYQLSSVYTPGAWNESYTPYFVRHYPHRLQAEMLLDAIARATNVPAPATIQGIGSVQRAMQFPDTVEPAGRAGVGQFLDEFGRGDRDDTARSSDTSISQALSMMNNTLVTTRVRRSTANSTVAKVLASTTDPAAITDQLYLATLSRYPTADEKTLAVAYLKAGTLANRTEDLQFALLNQLEFLFD